MNKNSGEQTQEVTQRQGGGWGAHNVKNGNETALFG